MKNGQTYGIGTIQPDYMKDRPVDVDTFAVGCKVGKEARLTRWHSFSHPSTFQSESFWPFPEWHTTIEGHLFNEGRVAQR